MIARVTHRVAAANSATLDRLILALAAVLVVSILGFATFYVLDRDSREPRGLSPLVAETERLVDAVRASPGNLAARLDLARVYGARGQHLEAAEQYRAALVIDEQNTYALSRLGETLIALGETDEALTHFESIIASAESADLPGSLLEGAHFFVGRVMLDRGDAATAIAHLERAVAIERSDADAWYALGAAYVAGGRADDAVAALTEATRYVPGFADAYALLATTYEDAGLVNEARYARGMQHYALGDFDRAAAELEPAVAADDGLVEAHVGLGLVRERQGRGVEAVALYLHALALDPENFNANAGLFRLEAGAPEHAGGKAGSFHE